MFQQVTAHRNFEEIDVRKSELFEIETAVHLSLRETFHELKIVWIALDLHVSRWKLE